MNLFVFALNSVRYTSEANWHSHPEVTSGLVRSGGGSPAAVQDVNEAHLLPVFLQEMRERWCVLFPARSVHAQEESGAGRCVKQRVFTPRFHTPTRSPSVESKMGSRKQKGGSEGSDHRMSLGFPEEHSFAGDKMCLNCMFFRCVGRDVTPDTCCTKSNWLACMSVCVCVCVFSWSSSDTCWSQSGWSINWAPASCACE